MAEEGQVKLNILGMLPDVLKQTDRQINQSSYGHCRTETLLEERIKCSDLRLAVKTRRDEYVKVR